MQGRSELQNMVMRQELASLRQDLPSRGAMRDLRPHGPPSQSAPGPSQMPSQPPRIPAVLGILLNSKHTQLCPSSNDPGARMALPPEMQQHEHMQASPIQVGFGDATNPTTCILGSVQPCTQVSSGAQTSTACLTYVADNVHCYWSEWRTLLYDH